MERNFWLQKHKEERQSHLNDLLRRLVDFVREEKRNLRRKEKLPAAATKRILEREILELMEFEKEEHGD